MESEKITEGFGSGKIIYRIRRIPRSAQASVPARYLLCDDEGHPIQLLSGLVEANRMEYAFKGRAIFVREVKMLPNLDGLPGNTDAERILTAVRTYQHENRPPLRFGIVRPWADEQDRMALKECHVHNLVPGKMADLNTLWGELKSGDDLALPSLDAMGDISITEAVEHLHGLMKRRIRITLLDLNAVFDDPDARQDHNVLLQKMLDLFAETDKRMRQAGKSGLYRDK